MIGRLRRYFEAHGARGTFGRLLEELRGSLYRTEEVTLLMKMLDEVVVTAAPAGLNVEPLTEQHLPGLAELNRKRGYEQADRRFRAYLEDGIQGFVGLEGAQIVCYYWWVDCSAPRVHPDLEWLEGSLQIEPGDVYGSDFFLLAEARGRNLAGAFLTEVEGSLARQGFKRLWGYVDKTNRPARWLYSSRGYLPMGDLTVRQILRGRRRVSLPTVKLNGQ